MDCKVTSYIETPYTQVENEYKDLLQIWTYPEWKECINKKQEKSTDNELIIVKIYSAIMATDDKFVPILVKDHVYTYLNEQLNKAKFFTEQACRIAKIASINFKIEVPKLKSCKTAFTITLDEKPDMIFSANVLPLIHESSYFRLLFTGDYNEQAMRAVTLNSLDGALVSNICWFLETNEVQYLLNIQEDALSIYQYLDMWNMPAAIKRVNDVLKTDSALTYMLEKEWSFELYRQSLLYLKFTKNQSQVLYKYLLKNFEKLAVPQLSSSEICTLISTISMLGNGKSLKKKCISFVIAHFKEIIKKIRIGKYEEVFKQCLEKMRGWRSKITLDQIDGKHLAWAILLLDKDQRSIHIKTSLKSLEIDKIVWPEGLKEITIDDGSCFGDEQWGMLIKQCPDLQCIHIKGAAITNLGPLKHLEHLKILKLPAVKCNGLETLPCHNSIETVDFSSMCIEDLSPLKRLSNLRVVILQESSEVDLSFISLLDRFELLDISKSKNDIFVGEQQKAPCEQRGGIKLEGVDLSEKKKKKLLDMFPNCTFYYK